MQLILLAAGRGSRLPKEFRTKPKCLVKLNSKSILDHNKKFFQKFTDKITITGYKQNILKKITRKFGFRNIFNKQYLSTNMVYSLFLARKKIKQDVVIIYGDVIFNPSVYNLIKSKKNIIPVKKNWLENWKKRMSIKKILIDAENLKVKKDILIEIGTKIKNSYPKYQFMGIVKLNKKSYFKSYNYFKTLRNKKIDMTNFINLCIKNKIINLKIKKYEDYWFEIDTANDFKFANKEIKKW